MAKLGSKSAAIYYHAAGGTRWNSRRPARQAALTEPLQIATDGCRWLAVVTAVSCERRVAQELSALGFKAYCPLGRKMISWDGGRQLKQKIVREFPVFSRYIFVGIPMETQELPSVLSAPPAAVLFAGGAITPEVAAWINENWGKPKSDRVLTELSKSMSDKIVSILGDSAGPIIIPSAAIAHINALELAGEWDEAKYKPQNSPYQPGTEVKIPRGPYAGFLATIDAQESETRLRVLVTMFGQRLAVPIDVDQVELCA